MPDCLAGLTVAIMGVPEVMSYAGVAGMDAKYGLYSLFYPLAICAYRTLCFAPPKTRGTQLPPRFHIADGFFGTSPHLVSGPTAIVSLLVCVNFQHRRIY